MSTMPEEKVISCCPGTGNKAVRKGSKYVRGQLRYLCTVCGGHFAKNSEGNLRHHGYRLHDPYRNKESIVSHCAVCNKAFDGLDYLCPKCRR